MATKADFTTDEWTALQRGVTGSGMLVSLSDRDFTDSFGEASAMAKYLANQQLAAPTDFLREIAKAHGSGFGLTTSPQKMRDETIEALRTALGALNTKAPEEVDGYKSMVIGVAQAVADAKGGGTSQLETAMIVEIKAALAGS